MSRGNGRRSLTLIDSNAWIDLLKPNKWTPWSSQHVADLIRQRRAVVNAVVLGELKPNFDEPALLDFFIPVRRVPRLPIPAEAGWPAGRAFKEYRERGGRRTSLLCDFLIGAHAEVAGYAILTRDATRFHTYFPSVSLITPED